MKTFEYHSAINYSGYRHDQSPRDNTYPTEEQILEDLKLLEGEFFYLRIYDCSIHAYRVLKVITEHKLPFQVMLGLSLKAEENHVKHPYFYTYKKSQLVQHQLDNEKRVQEIIELAHRYNDIVSSISIGNETRSIWNNNRIPIHRLVEVALHIKEHTTVPVTFCEEYQTWIKELQPLAEVVDFISLHTYPAWQGYPIEKAVERAIDNFGDVQEAFPNKDCIITETGWPTSTHGNRIQEEQATVKNQKIYNKDITKWGKEHNVLIYLFEAFDEPWKGGNDPKEPEKHWGIYYEDRTRK